MKVLFSRPGSADSVDEAIRFSTPRLGGDMLPVTMLRLASAVKYGTGHRVVVHDARGGGPQAERSVREVAAVHRPDVAVVWLHPALLAAGLDAARAVRQAGCSLVLGSGPLVDLWQEGARRIPELDGLVPSGGEDALLQALSSIASGGTSAQLAAALARSPGPAAGGPFPLDRKLLDYAEYRGVPGPSWSARSTPEPSRLSRSGSSDKGRFAASVVLLHDAAGQVLAPEAVIEDMVGCDLLGIPWQALLPSWGCESPRTEWWSDFLSRLSESVRTEGTRRRVRLRLPAEQLLELPLLDLRASGVVAIDLGSLEVGASERVDAVLQAASEGRRASVEVAATAVLGQPGYSLDDERAGLARLQGAGVATQVVVAVRPGTGDPASWFDWLDAPAGNFVPPGLDPERLLFVRRNRRVDEARDASGQRSGLGIARRLRALLGG